VEGVTPFTFPKVLNFREGFIHPGIGEYGYDHQRGLAKPPSE